MHGIDVSNFQPNCQTPAGMEALLSSLSPRPAHVVVRLSLERQSMVDIAAAQLRAAVACGATAGGYLWLYHNQDPRASVRSAIAVAAQADVTLTVLWLDIEPYTDGSLPNVAEIQAALDECDAQGVRGGIYTGAWVWPRLNNTNAFASYPLWAAIYDGHPTLAIAPFGGWTTALGHQWADQPLDRDVFDASVT